MPRSGYLRSVFPLAVLDGEFNGVVRLFVIQERCRQLGHGRFRNRGEGFQRVFLHLPGTFNLYEQQLCHQFLRQLEFLDRSVLVCVVLHDAVLDIAGQRLLLGHFFAPELLFEALLYLIFLLLDHCRGTAPAFGQLLALHLTELLFHLYFSSALSKRVL